MVVSLDSRFKYGRSHVFMLTSLIALLCIASCASPSLTNSSATRSIDSAESLEDKAIKAWLYFYPLLLTQTKLAAEEPLEVNSWNHSKESHSTYYNVDAQANTDIVYSRAWLDLRQGPINVHLPDMDGRYFVIQAIDQWSQMFSVVGSRTIGSKASTVVYLPPGMKKEQYPSGHWPIDAHFVETPSNKVLLLARLQRGGPDKASQISGLHSQFILRRHAETFIPKSTDTDKTAVPLPDALLEQLSLGKPPTKALQDLEPADYFSWATALWGSSEFSLSASDREFASDIIQLGLYPGRAIQWQDLTERRQLLLASAAKKAALVLTSKKSDESTTQNGWRYRQDSWYLADGQSISVSEPDNYELRARMALRSPGHLPKAELVSVLAGDKQPGGIVLDGGQGQQYELTLTKNNLPPASGFWSLAVHDSDGKDIDSFLGRSRLGSDSHLTEDADGNVSIYFSHENPHGEHSSDTFNWLPIPAKDFRVELRVYWPSRSIGSDGWVMPAILPR